MYVSISCFQSLFIHRTKSQLESLFNIMFHRKSFCDIFTRNLDDFMSKLAIFQFCYIRIYKHLLFVIYRHLFGLGIDKYLSFIFGSIGNDLVKRHKY